MEQFECIKNALDYAKEKNLEVEVIYSAFKFLKNNPNKNIDEALEFGLIDWDL